MLSGAQESTLHAIDLVANLFMWPCWEKTRKNHFLKISSIEVSSVVERTQVLNSIKKLRRKEIQV
jgi:hypothetical protein